MGSDVEGIETMRALRHVFRGPARALTTSRNETFLSRLEEELQGMRAAGTFKVERVLESPQSGAVTVAGGPIRHAYE